MARGLDAVSAKPLETWLRVPEQRRLDVSAALLGLIGTGEARVWRRARRVSFHPSAASLDKWRAAFRAAAPTEDALTGRCAGNVYMAGNAGEQRASGRSIGAVGIDDKLMSDLAIDFVLLLAVVKRLR